MLINLLVEVAYDAESSVSTRIFPFDTRTSQNIPGPHADRWFMRAVSPDFVVVIVNAIRKSAVPMFDRSVLHVEPSGTAPSDSESGIPA